jgi:hypothetical protein
MEPTMTHAPYPPESEYTEGKDPADIIRAIRTQRNGEEQASGDLASLQAGLGDADMTRIMLQCGYALGYCHSAMGQPPHLKPAALAWTAVAELFGHHPLGLGIFAVPPPRPGPAGENPQADE